MKSTDSKKKKKKKDKSKELDSERKGHIYTDRHKNTSGMGTLLA